MPKANGTKIERPLQGTDGPVARPLNTVGVHSAGSTPLFFYPGHSVKKTKQEW